MKNQFFLIIIGILIMVGITIISVSLIPDINALSKNTNYVILSEKYFFVFGLDEQSNVFPIDGGILYNSEWNIINKTNVTVEQYDDKGNSGRIIGTLNSGEIFWFTWNLTINSDVVTESFVYDGETLTSMSDYKTYMTRLFFPG